MSNHYKYDPVASTHGKFVQQMSTTLDNTIQFWTRNMAMFTQMLDGDGSQDAHYVTFRTRVGCADDATARALFAELSAAFSKFSGDGTVSVVNTALKQVVARTTA